MANALGGTYRLPSTSITLNRVGYGCMQLAGKGVWGPPKDMDEALAVLQTAAEAGVNHFDTSDFYGPHITNQIIRKALHPYKKGLTIVTKVGFKRGADRSWQAANSAQELTDAIQDNLKNLGLEEMDIVNLRLEKKFGLDVVERSLETLLGLKKKGLIRHIGLSNVTEEQITKAQEMTDIVCVQNEYNLAKRADDQLIDQLAAQNIPYVPFFPLGGFSPLQSTNLENVATRLEASPMQVALAWLLKRSPNILLIPGTSSVDHLHENLAAPTLELSADIMGELESIGPQASDKTH